MAGSHDELPSQLQTHVIYLTDPQKDGRQILVQIGIRRKGESDIGSLAVTEI